MHRSCFAFALLSLSLALAAPHSIAAAEKMELADGKIVLTAPDQWKKKMPTVRIIDFEFEVPAVEGDERPGRLTVMGAGGSVEDNINRWISQFEQKDGGASKEKTKQEETKIAGQKVYLVDISGTFKDQPGPFAPAVKRENYRMLAAIISTEKNGQYFVKFYGPKATVEKNEDAFKKMIDGMKVK